MTLRVIRHSETVKDIFRRDVTVLSKYMTPDVSNYAKGRMRVWLFAEWDLKNKKFIHAPQSHIGLDILDKANQVLRLYTDWQAEIGLLTFSTDKEVGITYHRDDSYADYESWGINLSGDCKFYYKHGYPEFRYSKERDEEKEEVIELVSGDIYQFNCKNLHQAMPSKNRWALNLWRVSDRALPLWEAFLDCKEQPRFKR